VRRLRHGFAWQLAGQLFVFLLLPFAASAHEARPAYLAINETAQGQFSILWRTPVLAGMRLPVVLKLPDRVKNLKEPVVSELSDSLVERRWVDAGPSGLTGERVEFMGLQLTITDVLVRLQMRNGTVSTTLVRPNRPWIEIAARQGPLAVAGAYLMHGIEHILFGFDHLLFVLALILIVRDTRMLLLTVTAFTVAHSITLSLATLGLVQVPGPPVEACIALSILLVASEIVRLQGGGPSLTATKPWGVAFAFGLLHGLGFASALIDIGLPQRDVPLALFAFNFGVELGQLAFIAVVLAIMRIASLLPLPAPAGPRLRTAASYAIGSVAAFWSIERLVGFWV
jgi:hydrogenase/urease accessory protein HupE